MATKKPASASSSTPTKSKKPRLKGKNHPRNLHKAFRSSGNGFLIKSYLETQNKGHAGSFREG